MTQPVTVIRGTNDKPSASSELGRILAGSGILSGNLFIGFPIIGTPVGKFPIDATFISIDQGVVIIDLVEGRDLGDFEARQDDLANKLESRFRLNSDLFDRRQLKINISVLTFAPAIPDVSEFSSTDYPVANSVDLEEKINAFCWENNNRDILYRATSALESISSIRKSKTKRIIKKAGSRGDIVRRLEESISTLDNLQNRAVIETVDGVQRIRGLAGSGKTIVLALKAAYLHAQHPEWKIAVTFNTRSLKGQFKRLINGFVMDQTGDEPDWDKLKILNAWGAPGGSERDGIYHALCRDNGFDYIDFSAARRKFDPEKEFESVCNEVLEKCTEIKAQYDAILIDEAQDFPTSFIRMCYEILGPKKRLVYAYDELQSLSSSSLPSPEIIFGNHANGTPKVKFTDPLPGEARRDVILSKCYRNSRPVLVAAHALGFGINRTPTKREPLGIVQMFDHPALWEEIGYAKVSGDLLPGRDVTLARTEEASPRFLEDHSPIDDLIQFISFENEDEQAEWLASEIKKNIQIDELRHDDIVVINPDPLSTRKKVGEIRRKLFEAEIPSHLAGVDTDPDIFFQPDMSSITFTGIYRAKGNEAAMVYIINAQDCHASLWNLATIRNRLFTAITRSKAWVRILGVGNGINSLKEEYDRLKNNDFKMTFKYPTSKELEQIKIVHRDMSQEEKRRIDTQKRSLIEIMGDIKRGAMHLEDLDDDLIEELESILAQRKGNA